MLNLLGLIICWGCGVYIYFNGKTPILTLFGMLGALIMGGINIPFIIKYFSKKPDLRLSEQEKRLASSMKLKEEKYPFWKRFFKTRLNSH